MPLGIVALGANTTATIAATTATMAATSTSYPWYLTTLIKSNSHSAIFKSNSTGLISWLLR